MEELQTDTLSDYGKNQSQENPDLSSITENENDCAATLLNGCEELDPLDLMDHCDNVSIASNSDVWKGSDSEDEKFEKKETSVENVENNKEDDKGASEKGITDAQIDFEAEIDKATTNRFNSDVENVDKPQDETGDKKQNDIEELDLNKTGDESDKSKCNETEKIPEQSVDTLVNENEEKIEKEESEKSNDKIVNNKNEGEEQEQNKNETTDSSHSPKDNQDVTSGEVVTNDKIDKPEENPLDDKEPSTEVTDKDPLSNEENKEPIENKLPNRNNGDQDDDCQMDYDADEDDDFDPSLLCPEVSMAVDDDPVITTNGLVPDDTGPNSLLPYEPTFSTFVDEVTGAEVSFNLTEEEQELRKRIYGQTNPVQLTRIHCTACNVHLGSALEGQNNRFVHPLLKVLICKECYHFYTSGEFEKDEDGSELYCRWCGQGGQVLCCSKCEYVFCKRCIRTNFGRKKMFEIRDSDSWDCFRCNPAQIITQRIACYEFFEHIRREMSRAATLNSSELWSRDHTRCCTAKKRPAENGEEVKKAKRRKHVDPDYHPLTDKKENSLVAAPTPSTSAAGTAGLPIGMAQGITLPKPIQIVPRYNITINKTKDNDIEFVRQIPAPHVTIGPGPRPTYRTIMPSHGRPVLQSAPTLVRISSQPVQAPFMPPTGRIYGPPLQNRNNSSMMKHEWFEKTVRAAARVNSHLSYTLTQLNKAQSQAASVEELAVVHNKLQEILSSSINSLIQIRKNLRTEFITGIKTVRLPSKKVETSNNDDDVIFVSAPTTMCMASTSQIKPLDRDPLIIIDKSNSAPKLINALSAKSGVNTERPKGYLKVKSVVELQSVPSECITIPDDPLPPTLEREEPGKKKEPSASKDVVCNDASKDSTSTKTKTDKEPDSSAGEKSPTIDLSEVPKSKENSFNEETDKSEPKESTSTSNGREIKTRGKNNIIHNTNGDSSADIKRMMSVKVYLQRDNLDELRKKTLASKAE